MSIDAFEDPDVHAQQASHTGTEDTDSPFALPQIMCRNKRSYTLLPLSACPAPTIARIKRWTPDTVVVLGGGLLRNGQPNCATAERGYIAAQVYASLTSKPTMVFTGRASRWIRRRADQYDVQCIQRRIALGLPGLDAPRWQRQQGEPAVGQSFAVSEAESLCAMMLRALPEGDRAPMLARARFEVRAGDTVGNARRTRRILSALQSQRVLVLTSPFVNMAQHTYHAHGDRALSAFKAIRRGAPYALASVACPRHQGGMPYWYFESLTPGEPPERSRALTAAQQASERE